MEPGEFLTRETDLERINMTDSTLETGRQVVAEIFGEPVSHYIDGKLQSGGFGAAASEVALRHVFADTWTRPGLDRKTRSIATMAMLIALRATDELKNHVRGAVNNGCTVEEIDELILHAACYAGFPATAAAVKAAEEVLTEMRLLEK